MSRVEPMWHSRPRSLHFLSKALNSRPATEYHPRDCNPPEANHCVQGEARKHRDSGRTALFCR